MLTLGLIWQFVLVLILIRHELGDSNGRACAMLYGCGAPRSEDRARGWTGVVVAAPLHPHLRSRVASACNPRSLDEGFRRFRELPAGKEFFRGAWVWFAVVVVLVIFNTVLGEELLFRGLLLPRMKGVFGKYDWVANGVLFPIYHLHQPWTIPTALVDIFALAYPSRRFQSAWMGIIVHSTQSVFFFIVLLTLVAK